MNRNYFRLVLLIVLGLAVGTAAPAYAAARKELDAEQQGVFLPPAADAPEKSREQQSEVVSPWIFDPARIVELIQAQESESRGFQRDLARLFGDTPEAAPDDPSPADSFVCPEPELKRRSASIAPEDDLSSLQRDNVCLTQEVGLLRISLAKCHRNLADIYARNENYEQAFAAYCQAIKYDRRNTENYYYAGMVAALLERKEAVRYFRRYLQLTPQGSFSKKARELLQLLGRSKLEDGS